MMKIPSNSSAENLGAGKPSSDSRLHVDAANIKAPESGLHLREQLLAQPLNSAELFKDAHQIMIEHGSDVYCLRLTKQGKLILTK